MKIARKTKVFRQLAFYYLLLGFTAAALVGVVGNEQGTGTSTSAAGNVFAYSSFAVSL